MSQYYYDKAETERRQAGYENSYARILRGLAECHANRAAYLESVRA